MSWITFLRLGIFGFAFIVSLAMLGIAGHMANTNQSFRGVVYDFQGLGIATGVLSLVILAPLLVIGFLRKGAWMNMNVVEIPVIGFLCVLWLALASLTSTWTFLYPSGCLAGFNAVTKTYCNELFAIEGLAFVVWIFLIGYIITMIAICIMGKSRGHDVWFVAADVPPYFEHNPNAKTVVDPSTTYATPATHQPSMQTQAYPPQQQPMQQQYTGPQQQQGYTPQMQQQNTGYTYNTANGYVPSPHAVPSGAAQV